MVCVHVLHTVYALIFAGVYISRICNFRVFPFFKFAVAGYSGVEIFAGEIFADIRSESVYHNSIRQLQRCKTCWTLCWIRLKVSLHKWRAASEDFTPTRRYGRLSLEKGLVSLAKEATEKIRSLLQ